MITCLRMTVGAAVLLTVVLSVTACTRENYHPSEPQHSILQGPDRSQEWYKTNDDK
jgi:negative regulator of sigma E activity